MYQAITGDTDCNVGFISTSRYSTWKSENGLQTTNTQLK